MVGAILEDLKGTVIKPYDIFSKDFIYRLEGYWWIFVVAVLLTGLIAFVSVIWQTLKAARTNPAIELKKE